MQIPTAVHFALSRFFYSWFPRLLCLQRIRLCIDRSAIEEDASFVVRKSAVLRDLFFIPSCPMGMSDGCRLLPAE